MITDYVRILKVNMKTLIYDCTLGVLTTHVEDDTLTLAVFDYKMAILLRTGIRKGLMQFP